MPECDPRGKGCVALATIKGELKNAITEACAELTNEKASKDHVDHEFEKRDKAMIDFVEKVETAFTDRDTKVDKRLASQNARLWVILSVLFANALGLAFFLLRTAGD